MSVNESDEESTSSCPFCDSSDACEHLLLTVDKTFRTAEGGVLMDAFNSRWSVHFYDADIDFNEREAFDNLLEKVDNLSDAINEYDQEGGLGMSSAYTIFYVKTGERMKAAVSQFEVEIG